MCYVTEAINRQPFASKSQMDEAIKAHLGEHGRELSDTAVEILRLISRYACKYPGVAFLKNGTIARLIGKSRVTVVRNINRLISVGILERVTIMREVNGGNGANMYVIQAQSAADTPQLIHRTATDKPTEIKADRPGNQAEPYSFNKRNTDVLDTGNHPASLRHSIPTSLFDAMAPCFSSADELYRIYGVLLRSKAKVDRHIRAEEHPEYIDAFRACVRRFKGGHVRNLTSYLYAAWSKVSRQIKWREFAEIYG